MLHDELKKLILIIFGRICKPNVLIKWSGNESVFDSNNLLTIPQLPTEVTDLLNNSNTKEIEKKIFIENVKKHYINGALHILNKSSYGVSPKIKYFRCLQPPEIKKEQSCYDIGKVAHFLPVKVDITMLSDEWKLLRLENLIYVSEQRIDHFRRQVFNMKNSMDGPKFPLITNVVKCALSLSHGSADVERGFLISGKVLTEDKSAMSCKMLNSRLYIKDGLRRFKNKPDFVPITKDLICSSRNAHQKYLLYLEDQKQIETAKNKKKE